MNHLQIPTIEQVLEETDLGNGLHRWPTKEDFVEIPREQMAALLEAADDETNPDWFDRLEYFQGKWFVGGREVALAQG